MTSDFEQYHKRQRIVFHTRCKCADWLRANSVTKSLLTVVMVEDRESPFAASCPIPSLQFLDSRLPQNAATKLTSRCDIPYRPLRRRANSDFNMSGMSYLCQSKLDELTLKCTHSVLHW